MIRVQSLKQRVSFMLILSLSVFAVGLTVGGVLMARRAQARVAGPQGAVLELEQSAPAAVTPIGTGFTYQGSLMDGGNPANGDYNLEFRLFDAPTKGNQVGSTVIKEAVPVSNGLFSVELDFGDVFAGRALWLEVTVREGNVFTLLTPRQPLSAAPYAQSLVPGAVISGSVGAPSNAMLSLSNYDASGVGLRVFDSGLDGVFVDRAGRDGVYVGSAQQDGLFVCSTGSETGCAPSDSSNGLEIGRVQDNGIYINDAGQAGIQVNSAGGDGLFVCATGKKSGCEKLDTLNNGVEIGNADHNGIYIRNAGYNGLVVASALNDGVQVSGVKTGLFIQADEHGLLINEAGGDYIFAGPLFTPDFRVLNTGEVRSDVGFNTPAADFAELMALQGDASGYEPGDVLVISPTQVRAVALSSQPFSQAVIGVYSTEPGFVGGQPVTDTDLSGMAPVGMLGVVPTKVSAENGAIQPGDLLVTSATPGHAMRADDPPPGTVLGKALEPLEAGTSVILVLVTLQ